MVDKIYLPKAFDANANVRKHGCFSQIYVRFDSFLLLPYKASGENSSRGCMVFAIKNSNRRSPAGQGLAWHIYAGYTAEPV